MNLRFEHIAWNKMDILPEKDWSQLTPRERCIIRDSFQFQVLMAKISLEHMIRTILKEVGLNDLIKELSKRYG